MPDFAPNFTPRYKARYIAAGVEHTIQFRFAIGLSGSSIVTAGHAHAAALFGALDDVLADDFNWISAEWAAAGDDSFTPAGSVPSTVTGTIDVATFTATAKVQALHFPGRSTVSKVGVYVYGCQFDTMSLLNDAQDSRITASEDVNIAAAIATLNGGTSLCAINGIAASWYPYATVKVNDHLLKLVRRGTIS